MSEQENQKQEQGLEKEQQLQQALETLERFVKALAVQAGKGEEYGQQLWGAIRRSPGLLQELAYYHDFGQILCKYQVQGYTLADVLVWQVDHFKLYMDRPDEMNRYRQERLVLEAFEAMSRMEREPEKIIGKLMYESGQDAANG